VIPTTNQPGDPSRSLQADRLNSIYDWSTMMGIWKTTLAVTVLVAGCISAEAGIQVAGDDSGFAQLYRSGQSAMAAGRYDEARTDFERLEKMDPSVAEVYATLGVLYFKMGSFDRAIEEIRAARKLKPGLPGLETLLSLSLAESGKYREALPGLEKAFHSAVDPELKRQAGLELTTVYTHLEMDRRAAETALELRDLYKNDPEVLYNAGKILGNSAYLTMQSLFHGSGNSVWAQLAEAEAHESQGQFADAIKSYRSVLALDPHHVSIHYRMGRTYLAQWESSHVFEDIAAAEEEFAKEIEGDPGNANAAYELAGLRWKDGNEAAAEQLYESAIRGYPDFEEAEVGLGGVLLDEQKPSLAAPHLQRATVLRPDDEVAWYRLAQAERLLGDLQAQKQALTAFQKLHALSVATRNGAASLQSQETVTPQKLGAEAQP
jgi:tetratricopeptide (TPR) repeat protein